MLCVTKSCDVDCYHRIVQAIGMELSVNTITGNSVCSYLFYIIREFQTLTKRTRVKPQTSHMPMASGSSCRENSAAAPLDWWEPPNP